MKKTTIMLFWVGSFLLSPHTMANRQRISFDFDWLFHLGDDPAAIQPRFTPTTWQWEPIQLPHDWSIRLPFDPQAKAADGYLPGGIGLYRKEFQVPDSYKGKTVSILFDGVYHKSTVYLNGEKVGYHAYGYTGFEYDLSPYIKYGEKNIISLHVEHTESSRWYTGSGIYRHAWLQVTNPIHVTTWGTYVTTPEVTKDKAKVSIRTNITNQTPATETVQVIQLLVDKHGQAIKTNGRKLETVNFLQLPPNDTVAIEQQLEVENPHYWSIDDPYRYFIQTTIKKKKTVTDTYQTPFGIRTIEFSSSTGFSLNGQAMKLKGEG